MSLTEHQQETSDCTFISDAKVTSQLVADKILGVF